MVTYTVLPPPDLRMSKLTAKYTRQLTDREHDEPYLSHQV